MVYSMFVHRNRKPEKPPLILCNTEFSLQNRKNLVATVGKGERVQHGREGFKFLPALWVKNRGQGGAGIGRGNHQHCEMGDTMSGPRGRLQAGGTGSGA